MRKYFLIITLTKPVRGGTFISMKELLKSYVKQKQDYKIVLVRVKIQKQWNHCF